MSDIKRFNFHHDDMIVEDDGYWIEYENHIAAMQAKDAIIEQLQARIAELNERISDLEVSLEAERDLSGTYR